MSIESDIILDIGIDIRYSNHFIVRDDICVPLKLQAELSDRSYCEHLYNIHINLFVLLLREVPKRRVFDANYTKVNIDDMVVSLDIQ